mmetsp:Transcript_1247/g.2368  ORF Transcript_1247/g.2368 Transcript_1247/m.2368 type:complete len:88 (-) Transcript_1247:98-361(-)
MEGRCTGWRKTVSMTSASSRQMSWQSYPRTQEHSKVSRHFLVTRSATTPIALALLYLSEDKGSTNDGDASLGHHYVPATRTGRCKRS